MGGEQLRESFVTGRNPGQAEKIVEKINCGHEAATRGTPGGVEAVTGSGDWPTHQSQRAVLANA